MVAEGFLKQRIVQALVTVFLLWHTGALIIAPVPESYLVNSIHKIYKPYLTFFNINNGWAFFAPNPHTGVRMFYILQNAQGNQKRIDFTSRLTRKQTAFQRYTMMQDYLWLKASPYTQSATRFLCQRHKDFKPVQIQFEFHRANILSPEEYLKGVKSTDQKNLDIEVGDKYSCPQ